MAEDAGGSSPQNTYVAGNCTWWVRSQLSWVRNGWGNAAEWWANAQAQGFKTSQQPQVGSVAVWGPGVDPPQGYGHVAVVTATRPDGSFVVSEMNWQGLGKVDTRNVGDTANLLGFILAPGQTPGAANTGDQAPFGLQPVLNQLTSAGQVAGGALLVLAGIAVAAVLVLRPRLPGLPSAG